MSYQAIVTNGSDLNDWKKPGYYCVGTYFHDCKNLPVEASGAIFYLIVFQSYYIYQLLLSGNSKMYIRAFNADDKKWKPWS